MELLDVVLIVIAVAGAVMGWLNGFIGQIGSLAGIVAGVVACHCKGNEFAAWLGPVISPDAAGSLVTVAGCNIVLFLVVYIAVVIAARLLKTVVKIAFMGPLDHMAGAVFGVFKWWFLAGVFLALWAFVSPESSVATTAGTLVAAIRDGVLWILGTGFNAMTS
ncbi:MAG: CvpA family protein [Duncaniella sp.]|nr:CvpA family protein [Duncaniella sp.]